MNDIAYAAVAHLGTDEGINNDACIPAMSCLLGLGVDEGIKNDACAHAAMVHVAVDGGADDSVLVCAATGTRPQ